MGALIALDFCSTLEGAIDCYEQLSADYALSRIQERSSNTFDLLAEAANESWSAQVSTQDPRFESLLPPIGGNLQEEIEQLIAEPDGARSFASIPLMMKSLPRIQAEIDRLKRLSLEEGLLHFLRLLSRAEGARLDALAARLGWDGGSGATLDDCGKQLGITRERMRQIQQKALKRLPNHEVFMPALDNALALLEAQAPLSLEQSSNALSNAGITRTEFHPLSLLNAARLLGKKTTLEVSDKGQGKILAANSHTGALQLIATQARKLAGQSGVASVFQVCDALEAHDQQIGEEAVRRMLAANASVEFLDDDWFWVPGIPQDRNRLRNVARKILAVAAPQPVVSIRDGVRRNYRWRSSSHPRFQSLVVPPLEAMKAFFQRHDEFCVTDELVDVRAPVDHREQLGEADRIMVEVLRGSPAGVLDRKSFGEGCIARGMNENTFSVYTTYSCVLEHVGLDIWKLRGVATDPSAIEAVRLANQLKPRERRLLEYGWNEEGKLWLAARAPRLNRNSMVIGCPGPIQRYLEGQEFACFAKETGHRCGTIAVNERGSSYGYGVFIRRYGVDENDILLAEFDLATNTVRLSVDSEAILEDVAHSS